MNHCLRCHKPCEATTIFCTECQQAIRNDMHDSPAVTGDETPPRPSVHSHVQVASLEHQPEDDKRSQPAPADQETQPLAEPALSATPSQAAIAENAVDNLTLAAQHIQTFEHNAARRPHRASRLTPLHDISDEIQRENTPLPEALKVPASEDEDGLRLANIWPWIHDLDGEIGDDIDWKNQPDPLASRQFPRRAASTRIGAADLRRILAGRLRGRFIARPMIPGSLTIRNIFAILVVLAVIGLIIDSVLLSFAFLFPHTPKPGIVGPPLLTLSANTARIGQSVTIHIQHLPPGTSVLLTRDIEEVLYTNNGILKTVPIGTDGTASVVIQIDTGWVPGFHTILAEDLSNRVTVSSVMQLIDAGPSKPSHLLIDNTDLNMGDDMQGASTIQQLMLRNSGGGAITWAASSNQPWLLLAPTAGTFSTTQNISVAVSRVNLKPGIYSGEITFTSIVGAATRVRVEMSVHALPLNPGPVLTVAPPLLSFNTTDGGSASVPQNLTISNPGSKKLHWSLTGLTAVTNPLLSSLGANGSWLHLSQNSGEVDPGSNQVVQALVNNAGIVAGTYTDMLTFSAADGALNNPQHVIVSFTVQPSCGLTTSTGSLSFTSVAGLSNPSSQALDLTATQNCGVSINWHAQASNAGWLAVSPANGQLQSGASTTTAVWANSAGLSPGNYQGYIFVTAGKNTQTIPITLAVQPSPASTSPFMAASPLTLNFSGVQGQANPPSQVVTLVNNGGGPLYWHIIQGSPGAAWLGVTQGKSMIASAQSEQITFSINTNGMTPGGYATQVILVGADKNGAVASGSPQTITIHLLVQASCTLSQPSLSSLAFSATQGLGNPGSQTITTTASGNCSGALSWSANVDQGSSWLKISSVSGMTPVGGQGVSLNVAPDIAGLAPGTYTGHISIRAVDQNGVQPLGSPSGFSVTLMVLPPCSLQAAPTSLSFTAGQGQGAPASQKIALSETGNCSLPVSWKASGDAGSSSWLQITSGSGNDTGSGSSFGVSVNPGVLTPNVYTGQITLVASGSGATSVQNSPLTIPVTLTITGYSISGTALSCADVLCTAPAPFAGASVTLTDLANNQIASVVADNGGNYTFSSIPLGSYKIVVNGMVSSTHYTGSSVDTVNGNQSGIIVDAYPG